MKQKDSLLDRITTWFILLGGMSYVTYVAFQGNANARSIESIEKKQEAVQNIEINIEVMKHDIAEIRKILEEE